MFGELIEDKFARIGARVRIRPAARADLRVDIARDRHGEYFDLAFDTQTLQVEVVDVAPQRRHLLLMARSPAGAGHEKFVCGFDERHWFVAAIPGARGVSNVRTALEALKPPAVRDAEARAGVRFKDRQRRRNRGWVRQGEWFFVPAPGLEVADKLVLRNEPISRERGKPHLCQWVYRTGGTTVYVSKHRPQGLTEAEYRALIAANSQARAWRWSVMRRDALVYARGTVRHPDHAAIHLDGWHRVEMNTESKAPAMRHVAFLD